MSPEQYNRMVFAKRRYRHPNVAAQVAHFAEELGVPFAMAFFQDVLYTNGYGFKVDQAENRQRMGARPND